MKHEFTVDIATSVGECGHVHPLIGPVEPGDVGTERYLHRADAIHAAELAFGSGSNVYLRESEHGNVLLRLANDADAINEAAEGADDEWPVGEVQG